MGTAIKKHFRDFLAIAAMIAIALFASYVILQEQRLRIPVLEDKPFELKAEFETAQAVVPGQGQTIRVAGVKVGDVRYLASQPWPFPHSLMIGCIGTAQSTELAIDRNEIAEARWFTRAEVKSMLEGQHPEDLSVPGRHAIANRLIRHFVGET